MLTEKIWRIADAEQGDTRKRNISLFCFRWIIRKRLKIWAVPGRCEVWKLSAAGKRPGTQWGFCRTGKTIASEDSWA